MLILLASSHSKKRKLLKHKGRKSRIVSRKFVESVSYRDLSFPKEEIYGLTNQLRRASVSVPSNIAEGMSREYNKDINRFLVITRSSLVEIDTQIEIALSFNYLKDKDIAKLEEFIIRVFQMLPKMTKHYKS